MLEIYTATIYGVKKLKLDDSYTVMDITVKNKARVKPFAPSWNIVMDWKNGLITKETYTKEYLKLMRISFKENLSYWLDVIKKKKIVLCCYCHNGEFCHRYILVDLFIKVANKFGIEAVYKGEL